MGRILFGILFLFIANCGFSQNLTIDQMLKLSEKNLGQAQDFLNSNKWYFYTGVSETEDKYGEANFVFDRPNYKPGESAVFYMTYFYSESEKAQAIMVEFRNESAFNNYSEQLKNLDFELKDSRLKQDNIVKVYAKGKYVVEVTVPSSFNSNGSYQFMFMTKKSHRRMFDK